MATFNNSSTYEKKNMGACCSKARTYKDALEALNSLQSNFASLEALRKLGPSANRNELSLKEVCEYTRRLGYTGHELNRMNVIHITGTKGKGSVCAFTESILDQYRDDNGNGVLNRIGVFMSPHLTTVRERIRINNEPISEAKFTKYFFEVWDALSRTTSDAKEFPTLQPCDTVKPMYFKYLTILSFHVFMSEEVDTAIYEVGVGGQFDSTNIIEKPTVTGIANLGIDHTFMLGDTIQSITWNKTGIFKKGVPAFVSEQFDYPESLEVVRQRAKEKEVASLDIVNSSCLPPDTKLGLGGDFQKQNAALAIKLASAHLSKLGVSSSELPDYRASILPKKFEKGLANVSLGGRCQIVRNKKDYEKITWYVDGAHTIESVKASSQWFASLFADSKEESTKVLIFNQQGRGNIDALVSTLYNTVKFTVKFDYVIFTTNITWSDGNYNTDLVSLNNSQEEVSKLSVQKQSATIWSDLDQNNDLDSQIKIFPDIETSTTFVKSLTSNGKQVDVFVSGSLHLVGGLLVVLNKLKE